MSTIGIELKTMLRKRPLALLVGLFAALYLILNIVLVRTDPDLIS
jgi:hypothetical protein